MGIDVTTGRRQVHVPIDYQPGWPAQNVVEGLVVLDLDDGRIPWMRRVVHVLVFDANASRTDYVWFRHYDVADGAERALFRAE